jgi:hypothetical protein
MVDKYRDGCLKREERYMFGYREMEAK